jgi:hypothetical protein
VIEQSRSDWMKTLPIPAEKLSFKELKNFKDFQNLLNGELAGPEGWKYFFQSFQFLQFFAFICIDENKYPALTNCWKDLEKKFVKDPIFDDGIFIQSWIYFDFPLSKNGQTLLDEFQIFCKENSIYPHFEIFINEMKRSRLGLYQEIRSTKKITKFREVITGRVISSVRSVPYYEKGELFLTRIVEYKGDYFQFGDPKCWHSDYKDQIQEMIEGKLFYFDGNSTEEEYETFMKLAGPYWFSCVCTNQEIDILNPDHYLSYSRGK